MKQAIDFFQEAVGARNVLLSPDELKAYGTDWTKRFPPAPSVIVLPANTAEVARVLKYCHDNKLAVVPSGGRTGLAAGAVAPNGEVVVSLSRMNKIHGVDPVGMTIRAEAGVTTQALQDAAREAGLYFPIDLAAKGSCQIGGNVATNAGGVKLIRYGGTREQVLGMEVVLADGSILDMNSSLRKNNSGYDLRQLFIGSEGTLGIVTNVTFRLVPKPKTLTASMLAVDSFGKVPDILAHCNKAGVVITAFEFFTKIAHEIVLKHIPGAKTPFEAVPEIFVLLELEEESGANTTEGLLEGVFEAGLITDAVIGQSSAQHADLWKLRENITEAISAHGQVRKNDISLAVEDLAPFIRDLEPLVARSPKEITLILFGHIGDGNLHINYSGPFAMDKAEFSRVTRGIEKEIFDLLGKYKGSISAEHGIGLLKKEDLHYCRTSAEIDIMRKIKAVLDPRGIMNPGKIFDLR